MNAHTLGPWTFQRAVKDLTGPVIRRIIGRDGETIAYTDGLYGDVDEANAQLIALAPQLLDALDAANDYLQTTLAPCDDDCECILHTIEPVLRKARQRKVVFSEPR